MGKAGRPRLIAKVYEVDLVGGSWPRSGQREPPGLPSVWIRDEAHRGHHEAFRGWQTLAPPHQDRPVPSPASIPVACSEANPLLRLLANRHAQGSALPCPSSWTNIRERTAAPNPPRPWCTRQRSAYFALFANPLRRSKCSAKLRRARKAAAVGIELPHSARVLRLTVPRRNGGRRRDRRSYHYVAAGRWSCACVGSHPALFPFPA